MTHRPLRRRVVTVAAIAAACGFYLAPHASAAAAAAFFSPKSALGRVGQGPFGGPAARAAPPGSTPDLCPLSVAATAAAHSRSVSASVAYSSSRLYSSPLASAAGINSRYLVRILFLRGMAFVYGTAFLVAFRQNAALIGDSGITPARTVLDAAEVRGRSKAVRRERWLEERKKYRGNTAAGGEDGNGRGMWGLVRDKLPLFRTVADRLNQSGTYRKWREVLWDRSDRMNRPITTLLWFARDRSKLNPWLDGIAIAGLASAATVFLLGAANVPLLLTMWVCQRSLMAVGGPWYGYGWEPQLAELGFHALFLVPLLSLDPFSTPIPSVAVWAIRWHLFRIMMGAGLIKLKSDDPKWKFPSLTAMDFFYETQPVPNPLSRYFHDTPRWWHKFEVLANHFVELVAPWLLIVPGLPRKWRIAGGVLQLTFQGVLILSGNLSFLNWLTALPAVFCLDDMFLSRMFGHSRTTSASVAAYTHLTAAAAGSTGASAARLVVDVLFAALIVRLSIPVVKNLLARKQLMNASFDPLRLISTYGAFGVVSEDRDELVIESADNIMGPWREYEFKVKPGDVYRSPRFISPYHHRLDWQMWIASQAGSIERSLWLYPLLLKLLEQDKGVVGLLSKDPWAISEDENEGEEEDAGSEDEETEEEEPTDWGSTTAEGSKRPKYIRIEKYRYKFNYDGADNSGERPYWKRERVGKYFPRQGIMTEEALADYIQNALGTSFVY